MTWPTLADLVARAGEEEILQVADRDGDGVADPDVIAAALDNADVIIGGFLAGRYRMPLDPVPELVKIWAVSIARYYLHRDGAPDHVVRDWKEALAQLREVLAGRITLTGATGNEPAGDGAGRVSSAGPDPVFTKENLEGWL